MLRPAVIASWLAMGAMALMVAPAAAAAPPSPPPGSVSVQPAGLSSDGEGNPGAYHCGIQAGAAGSGYSAQPAQVTSSGASTPSGCGSNSPSSAGGQTASSGGGGAIKIEGTGGTQPTAGQTSGGDLVPAATVHNGSGFIGSPLWIGMLLLLALLLLLIGFAIGRRRPVRA